MPAAAAHMQMSATPALDITHLLQCLSKRRLPALVVIPFVISDVELRFLLADTRVSGCILAGGQPAVELPSTGSMLASGEWRFPDTDASSLIYLGWSGMIRPRRLLEAMRRGMNCVTAMEPDGNWRTKTIPVWYLAYLQARWQQFQVMRHLDRVGKRLTKWSVARDAKLKTRLKRARLLTAGTGCTGTIMQVTGTLGAGGAERQLMNTTVALAERGYRTEVLCFHTGRAEFDFYLDSLQRHAHVYTFANLAEILIRYRDERWTGALGLLRHREVVAFMRTIPLSLREPVMICTVTFLLSRPGVVHLWQDSTNIVGALAALLAGVPRIVMAGRNLAPHHFFYFRHDMRPLYRFLLSFPQVSLINNSHAGAASYAQWLDIPEQRIGVIHNGLDSRIFSTAHEAAKATRERWGVDSGALVVGGIFRFSPEKDPLLWLETAALILTRLPNCRFVIFGEGAMRAEIENQAKQLGLNCALLLAGVTDDVPAVLCAFNLLLLTSRQEGLPNVLIEAQFAGCPVVTTDVGGARETFVDGVTGWAVSERTATALSVRCCQVLGDITWRNDAARKGPEHVVREFGIDRMLQDTLKAYGPAVRHA